MVARGAGGETCSGEPTSRVSKNAAPDRRVHTEIVTFSLPERQPSDMRDRSNNQRGRDRRWLIARSRKERR